MEENIDTEVIFTDGTIKYTCTLLQRRKIMFSSTERSVEYVFLDTMLTGKYSCNWQECGTKNSAEENKGMLDQL